MLHSFPIRVRRAFGLDRLLKNQRDDPLETPASSSGRERSRATLLSSSSTLFVEEENHFLFLPGVVL